MSSSCLEVVAHGVRLHCLQENSDRMLYQQLQGLGKLLNCEERKKYLEAQHMLMEVLPPFLHM